MLLPGGRIKGMLRQIAEIEWGNPRERVNGVVER